MEFGVALINEKRYDDAVRYLEHVKKSKFDFLDYDITKTFQYGNIGIRLIIFQCEKKDTRKELKKALRAFLEV